MVRDGYGRAGIGGEFNCPDAAANPRKILLLSDFLVAKKLGPRAIGCISQILNRTVPSSMPSSRGLVGRFTEEGKSGIAMTEAEPAQVAPPADMPVARAINCLAATPSTSNSEPSRSMGRWPSSRARARVNQRRIP